MAAYSNASMCSLKLQRPADAIVECDCILTRFEPFNVKAIFRKGTALQQIAAAMTTAASTTASATTITAPAKTPTTAAAATTTTATEGEDSSLKQLEKYGEAREEFRKGLKAENLAEADAKKFKAEVAKINKIVEKLEQKRYEESHRGVSQESTGVAFLKKGALF